MTYIHAMFESQTIPPFRLTDSAAARIAEIVAAQPGAAALRVEVLAGGCSGFQYKFDLTADRTEDDLESAQGDARVFIDPTSLDLLAGSELDYTDNLIGAHFAVRNPNAASSCGCGASFALA